MAPIFKPGSLVEDFLIAIVFFIIIPFVIALIIHKTLGKKFDTKKRWIITIATFIVSFIIATLVVFVWQLSLALP